MGYLQCPRETQLLLKEKKGKEKKRKENVEHFKRTRLERSVPYFYMRYYPIAIDVVCQLVNLVKAYTIYFLW